MKPARALVVDDEESIRDLVCTLLERAGLATIAASNGRDGLRKFFDSRPDLVLLDISMPDMDGLQVLEQIRNLSDVPVIMLTARAGELDKVRGLKSGADDYVAKPFGRQELIARVERLLRRRGERQIAEPEVLSDSLTEIDFAQARATAAGNELPLTPLEFKLLAAFVRHPNQVLSHDQLRELVWGGSSDSSRDQVKLYVGYLRRKLREVADLAPIETVRGFGYRYREGADGR